MTWVALAALIGVLFTYPSYFYLLYEFKMRLARDHPVLWQKRVAFSASPGFQIAYKALREVREGKLDGVGRSCLYVAALTVVLFVVPGCSTTGKMKNQSIAMIALNTAQPFVSEGFAKKVVLLVLDDRYPKSVFLPQEGGTVVDDGDVWSVTYENALLKGNPDPFPIVDGVLLPRALTFDVRKADAAIVDIH